MAVRDFMLTYTSDGAASDTITVNGRGETDRRHVDRGPRLRGVPDPRQTVRRVTDRRFAELLTHFGGSAQTPDSGTETP